jgi:hypothetical protein
MIKATYLGYMFETGVYIPHFEICDSSQRCHVSGYALARFGAEAWLSSQETHPSLEI